MENKSERRNLYFSEDNKQLLNKIDKARGKIKFSTFIIDKLKELF